MRTIAEINKDLALAKEILNTCTLTDYITRCVAEKLVSLYKELEEARK